MLGGDRAWGLEGQESGEEIAGRAEQQVLWSGSEDPEEEAERLTADLLRAFPPNPADVPVPRD